MLRFSSLLAALTALLVVGSCVIFGARPGQDCERTGDGFTSSDPCATECFDFAGTCPDGATITPNQCIYGDCEPGVTACAAAQACVQANDDRWWCVDASLCD